MEEVREKAIYASNDLAWIMEWYQAHCDGDWEHDRRIHIGTIDNPGWSLTVNLEDTELEQEQFDKIEIERSETDWITCFIRDRKFEGYCGASNLLELLQVFCNWADSE